MLAIGTLVIVSKEIVENLEAKTKPFNNEELAFIEKAPIRTWNGIVHTLLNKLYGNGRT